jgi:hypothetical protein
MFATGIQESGQSCADVFYLPNTTTGARRRGCGLEPEATGACLRGSVLDEGLDAASRTAAF